MMTQKFTRRDFIRGGLILVSGSAVALVTYLFSRTPPQPVALNTQKTDIKPSLTDTEEILSATTEPTVTTAPESAAEITDIPTDQPQLSPPSDGLPGTAGEKFPGRVVQVSHPEVHTWNYSDLNYWDFVNQSAVDQMVDQGLMSLTGAGTLADAWRSLIPNYLPGQVVAIKVSFNNTYDSAGSIEMIDGIIEPVNALIRGLNTIGVPNSSIVVYDSSRWLPTRFTDGCDYPGVLFRYSAHDPWGEGSTTVQFTPPGVSAFTQKLSREVAQANYLINMPVLKAHGMARLSMGMKNHYGSIEKPNDLHQWSSMASPDFSLGYNPITDLNNDPQIRDKTVLIVGDGIFAALKNNVGSFPTRWVSFGNQSPNSLFFSTDPVSIDCVMGDLLNTEKLNLGRGEVDPAGFAYLSLAANAGLGTYERGNPWRKTYSQIEFIKNEL